MSEDAVQSGRDEITLRRIERKQLAEFLPEIIDLYQDRELPELVDAFELMDDAIDCPVDGERETYEFGSDGWKNLCIALDELDSTRAAWLSAKIGRRADLDALYMGFTTRVPFVGSYVGVDPSRPE